MYTYSGFSYLYGRNQHDIIKKMIHQIKIKKNILTKKFPNSKDIKWKKIVQI